MKRLRVDSKTCTVNGSHFKDSSAAWTGLKMDDAEPRVQSTLFLSICGQEEAPLDIHLNVPWCVIQTIEPVTMRKILIVAIASARRWSPARSGRAIHLSM